MRRLSTRRVLLALGGLSAVLALVLAIATAGAADEKPGRLTGKVKVTRGGKAQAAGDVIVYLVGFTEAAPTDVPEMKQQGKAFLPPLLAITAGQNVSFPNFDRFFHNVFSLSPARKFDLGSFKYKQSKTKVFDKPGIVDVYCNIHPEMAATILVLPNRRFARTAADGSFAIDGVPPGTWTAFAYDRFAEKPAKATVKVTAGGTAEVSFAIEETRTTFDHKNKYGEKYGDGSGGYSR